ncbi:MAG: glycosyl hydrolase family 65 protein [Rhizobacter sp.]
MTDANDVILDPDDLAARASRVLSFALGNGVLFVLAVDPEVAFGRDGVADPVCFFSGGRLIDLPNGLALSWRHDGEDGWFGERPLLQHERAHRLSLSDGVAEREAVLEDPTGRQTRWRETRFVSLAHAHVVMLRWELTPLNWSGAIVVRSLLDLRTHPVAHPAWAQGGEPEQVVNLMPADGLAVRVRRTPDGPPWRVDVTLRTSGAPGRQAGRSHELGGSDQQHHVEVSAGAPVCIDVAMTVTVDDGAAPASPPGFEPELERHRAAWQSVWERVSLSTSDPSLKRAMRFNTFHLLQAVSPLSVGRDVGLPVWSASDRQPGHEAWDEALALPFYSLHLPAVARELLHHRARRQTVETPRAWWSAAAIGAWRHHLATHDTTLLGGSSGELLIACARRWATLGAELRSLPAAWTLRCATRLREHLDPAAWARLRERTAVSESEVERWDEESRRVPVAWNGDVLVLPEGDGVDTLTLLHLLGPDEASDLIAHLGGLHVADWYAHTVRHHAAQAAPGRLAGVARAGALAAVDPAASWAAFEATVHEPLRGLATVDDGLSFGAMGGVWDVLLRHYLGLWPAADGLRLEPRPPDALDGVAGRVVLSGRWVNARLEGRRLTLRTSPGAPPLAVWFAGNLHEVQPDTPWSVPCR